MVSRRLKSRSLKKRFRRTPAGETAVHYRRKRVGQARCAICKKPLHAVPARRPVELSKLAKSYKRLSRPYGGNLCSSCMRNLIKERVRGR